MFNFPSPSVYQSSRCFVSHGQMVHLDPAQIPEKGKPWSTFGSLDFVHKIDLLVPEESFQDVHKKLVGGREATRYSRVIMSLGQVLHGEFFTQYIKIGNIMMLSEGCDTLNNVFTLVDGILTMYLDRESYERAGLVGVPHGAKGDRGGKPRWVVTYNLRSPSMLHGKKGFERLLYACRNALQQPVTWLFCNLSDKVPSPDPLQDHHPIHFTSKPSSTPPTDTQTPPLGNLVEDLADSDRSVMEEISGEVYEWISLARLCSPRIETGDNIDPYLSQYRVPDLSSQPQRSMIRKITWQGFMPAACVKGLLADVITTASSDTWFSFSASCFSRSFAGDSQECSLLRLPKGAGQYLMWEIKREA